MQCIANGIHHNEIIFCSAAETTSKVYLNTCYSNNKVRIEHSIGKQALEQRLRRDTKKKSTKTNKTIMNNYIYIRGGK